MKPLAVLLLTTMILAGCAPAPATPAAAQPTLAQSTAPAAPAATRVPAQPTPAALAETPAQPAATAPAGEDIRTYTIDPAQSKASYAVDEVFINENNRLNTAIGVSQKIEGQVFLNFTHPEKSIPGPITVDLSVLTSDSSRRDNAIRGRWLESGKFPLATFTPKGVKGIPASYQDGAQLNLEVSGDLKIRDVTKPATFTVQAALSGQKLTGTATTELLMSDFGFSAPDIGGMLKAENKVKVTLEFVAAP